MSPPLPQVEVGFVARGGVADAFLSAGALTATERAFGVPPEFSKVEMRPDDLAWILRDGEKKFLGRGNVLSSKRPTPCERATAFKIACAG